MSRIDLHPEELFDRAQSGLASKDEQLRLKAHSESCPACRFEHALGEDCRQSAAPRDGDELVVARIRASALRALQRRSLARSYGVAAPRPRRWLLLACAAILVVGTGGAATVLWRAHRATAEQHAVSTERAATPPSRSPAPAAPASPPPAENAAPESPNETSTRVAESPSSARRAPRATMEDAPKPSSAAELFARANMLRRQNETTEALGVYRALQHDYPGSSEELVSRVTLGRLLLDRLGNAGAALAEFDSYLSRAPGGSLSEEALIGRALALGRLGRDPEERTAWSALLAAHPSSTYAARARERIQKLTGK
jgi:tetratricopeptide (TPR) repeat protein